MYWPKEELAKNDRDVYWFKPTSEKRRLTSRTVTGHVMQNGKVIATLTFKLPVSGDIHLVKDVNNGSFYMFKTDPKTGLIVGHYYPIK